ncbi:MAG TPA: MarR family transcriptional regulator [Gemmatimonadetes bacterium]|nr:MarR family transcriptional regulator [Gemmatimonadota bacterium]
MPRVKNHEGLDRDAAELQRVLTDLFRVYQFRDRDAICCYDISIGQSHGLERLANSGPMTLNEFAASLFLEKSSASRLADGLERKGYLKRKPRADDARYLQLDLTKRGWTLHDRIERDLIEERAQVLADLSAEERQLVIESIARLAGAACAGVSTDAGCCVRN